MAPSTANSERRKNARQSPPGLIYVELGPSNGGMMRDLSAEGFALRAMMPVQPGEQTPFSFALNANARIEGHGEILWAEESGRVAGIRFVELPAEAQTLLQSWLDGTLETPESEKPALAEAQSFEELREELRTPLQSRREPSNSREPSTKPHWALKPSASQEPTVPNPQEEFSPIPDSNTLHDEEAGTEPATHEPAEPDVEPAALPELPHVPIAQEPVEIRFEPLREQREDAPPNEENTSGSVGEKRSNRVDASILPDIADILIQPPMSERTSNWQQPFSEIGQEQAATSSWTDWFTLRRAVGIMALLALVVAFSVYRQALGEGLIWLGQRLGGSAATQASPPAPEDKTASGETNSVGTSVPASAPVPPPGSPVASKPDSTAEVTRPLGATVPTLPPTNKSSSPTADAASPGVPDSAQENGSAEYAHALQLLHDKNRDADLSEAVRLLWVSVEKGNPSAELTLAELYWRGEGVAHNCDQARILLSAAARKGNSDAEQRLRQFDREGCE